MPILAISLSGHCIMNIDDKMYGFPFRTATQTRVWTHHQIRTQLFLYVPDALSVPSINFVPFDLL